jgi:hypothetical protein
MEEIKREYQKEFRLTEADIHEAALLFLERQKKLHKAIVYFIENVKEMGNVSRVSVAENKKEAIVQIGENPPVFMLGEQQVPQGKRQPMGYKRKNHGLYVQLQTYLQKQKKAGKRVIPFDDVYEFLLTKYPELSSRYFTIYASDKRQQAKRGYKYDGIKRIFRV